MDVKDVPIYLEENTGVVVNVKGEMKSSAITRPVSQEHSECDTQQCCAHDRTAPGDMFRRFFRRLLWRCGVH